MVWTFNMEIWMNVYRYPPKVRTWKYEWTFIDIHRYPKSNNLERMNVNGYPPNVNREIWMNVHRYSPNVRTNMNERS